jgi:peptide/nickel transport system substrate-binding protein
MPAIVQDLYVYNPERAKQLLKDAGYPTGFKTKVVVSSSGTNVDYVAMIKDYLAKVGVDLQIDARDGSVYSTIANNRSNEEMIARTTTMFGLPYMMHDMRADSSGDASYWETPQTLAAYQTMMNTLGRDDSQWVKALHDVMPHVLENAWAIFMPVSYNYNIWWPWVKNFHGESSTGYARFNRNLRYLWIDQDMKKSMGY